MNNNSVAVTLQKHLVVSLDVWKPSWSWLLFRCCGVSTPFPALNRKSPHPRLTRLIPPSCPVRRASAASTRTHATRTSPSTAASAAAGSSRCCRPSDQHTPVSVMMDTKDKPSYHQRSYLYGIPWVRYGRVRGLFPLILFHPCMIIFLHSEDV